MHECDALQCSHHILCALPILRIHSCVKFAARITDYAPLCTSCRWASPCYDTISLGLPASLISGTVVACLYRNIHDMNRTFNFLHRGIHAWAALTGTPVLLGVPCGRSLEPRRHMTRCLTSSLYTRRQRLSSTAMQHNSTPMATEVPIPLCELQACHETSAEGVQALFKELAAATMEAATLKRLDGNDAPSLEDLQVMAMPCAYQCCMEP